MGYPKRTIVRSSLLAGQRNGQLTSDILTTYAGTSSGMPTVTLLKPAARGFRALRSLALQHGITLDASGPSDSFRPLSVQQQIFNQRYTTTYTGIGCKTCGGRRYCKRSSAYATAACPGGSNHGLACAIDIRNAYGARLDFLLRYALSYGFCWELDSEPWHLVWYPGDQIPQPVLAFEQTQGGFLAQANVTEEEWEAHKKRLAHVEALLQELVNDLLRPATYPVQAIPQSDGEGSVTVGAVFRWSRETVIWMRAVAKKLGVAEPPHLD